MLGFPGAGKTTTAKVIHEITGAVHLWADQIRRERFEEPTYSHEENIQLYDYLNELTAELLRTGQSVIFDTNFNFYKDRERLREIAKEHNAKTILLWVKTPKELAKERATQDAHSQDTRVLGNIPTEDFDRMASNLQEPRANEAHTVVDGTKVTRDYISKLLNA